MEVSTIVTLVLAGVSTFAGGFWTLTKNKLSKTIKLGRELLEVADALEMSLKDDKITAEEIVLIKKELADVRTAWKNLTEKKK